MFIGWPAGVAAQDRPNGGSENRRCLSCHGQAHIGELTANERRAMIASGTEESAATQSAPSNGPRPELVVKPNTLAASVHAGLACTACHESATQLPHAADLPPATCGTCHWKAESEVLHSAHADAAARGDPKAPTCGSCHTGHDVRPRRDREAPTYPLNVIKICGGCHAQHLSNTTNGHEPQQHIEAYLESVHGRAVSRAGLVVAATCVDCHGHHGVRPTLDPQSKAHRSQVAQTCGKCHEGIAETYHKSIHGQKLAAGDPKAPVCTDCHTAHSITHSTTPEFMLDIVGECGACHDEPEVGGARTRRSSFYDTYRESYHGQVTELGSTRAARCSDCHGAHDIRQTADTASRLHPTNRVQTCQECHPKANANFVKFDPHADYRDAKRYPLLYAIWLYFIIVMSGAFGFYGLHSILWFIRSLIERARHGPHPRFTANSHAIQRFTRFDRINHGFVIISFFGLTITGLPLRFSDHDWAKILVDVLGGGTAAGLLHRFFGIMLICNFAAHFYGMFKRSRRWEKTLVRDWVFGPNTMLPRMKDVKDCFGMFRWFFVGGAKPAFDRWTYWEKFDYTAEVAGSMIIGGSGLLLWFPTFFSKFLPGWVFNAAMIVHGYEALLAVGFIFTIHFFNAHLRLEKFPVDDVIFTGRLSEEEFKHERGVEYARLVETGQLDALKVSPAPPWQRKLAVVVGITAMTIGTTLVVLIILAGLGVI